MLPSVVHWFAQPLSAQAGRVCVRMCITTCAFFATKQISSLVPRLSPPHDDDERLTIVVVVRGESLGTRLTDQQLRVKRNHAQDRTTQPSNADLSNKESALYQLNFERVCAHAYITRIQYADNGCANRCKLFATI